MSIPFGGYLSIFGAMGRHGGRGWTEGLESLSLT